MLIGTCGFGSTGSSAVSDYLKEYSEVCVLDRAEFTIAFAPDGLVDLEYHVMHPHSRVSDSSCAIERFRYMVVKKRGKFLSKRMGISIRELEKITDDFITAITHVSWLGYQNYTNSFFKENVGGRLLFYKLMPLLKRKFNMSFKGYPLAPIKLSVSPSNFYIESQRFTRSILEHMGANFSQKVVLDQPFSGNNPTACFPFFEDPFAIVVDRDPRDNYVFACTKLRGNTDGFMPIDNVNEFIKYYRALRDNQPYKAPNERILRIQFEDMIYNYDTTTEVIREFLGLSENPNPKSIFDPAMSIANTQTFKRFPQYAEDVQIIERELPEYLFDFSKYPEPDLTGEMFFGKSPLNK